MRPLVALKPEIALLDAPVDERASTMLVPVPRCRHLASAVKNLVAGTILVAVALITGSLGGMLAVELFGTVLGLSPVPVHEFLLPAVLIAVAWFSAAFLVAMVLGIGNAGVLFHPPEKLHP